MSPKAAEARVRAHRRTLGIVAEGALGQLEAGATGAVVGDAHPAATGQPVLPAVDRPASRQCRAVDGPLDGGRDLGEERAVQIVPGTGIDRAGGTGRRRCAALASGGLAVGAGVATSVRAAVAVGDALAVGSTVGSVLAGAAATVDVADGSSRVWSAPMQPVATTATSIGRSSHGWDRRRAGRDRPGALDGRRVTSEA